MSSKCVLYAEDDENDAFFLKRCFKQTGRTDTLIAVPDGLEAIDYCSGAGQFHDQSESPRPALVLLDLKMPRKSGFEVLKWIRQESSSRSLPVVIFTSSLQDEDIDRAYLEGANAYLVKPSNPDELVSILKTVCDFWLNLNRTSGKRFNFSSIK